MDKSGTLRHNELSDVNKVNTPVAKILLLNGPNLNLLGTREPMLYGGQTLAGLESTLQDEAGQAGHALVSFQSNAEHALIERIHAAHDEDIAFILFNPAAFTHTSIALRDALSAVEIPFIEIHISNIHARETYRQHSFFSDLALGTISGLGQHGYRLALEAAVYYLQNKA